MGSWGQKPSHVCSSPTANHSLTGTSVVAVQAAAVGTAGFLQLLEHFVMSDDHFLWGALRPGAAPRQLQPPFDAAGLAAEHAPVLSALAPDPTVSLPLHNHSSLLPSSSPERILTRWSGKPYPRCPQPGRKLGKAPRNLLPWVKNPMRNPDNQPQRSPGIGPIARSCFQIAHRLLPLGLLASSEGLCYNHQYPTSES
jgi:hypothetical protein